MAKNPEVTNENQLNAALNQLYEEQFFAVCDTKAQLKQWIKTFLDIDLPDCTIDDNSNSNPMDFIWDVYSAAKDGDPNRTTFVVAASRNSAKTLASSIIEFLLMVHFARDIVHMAAILDQSLAAIRYLDKYLALPIISKFAKTDSKRIKELNRLPSSPHRPVGYSKLQVVVSTKKSANAQRASCLTNESKVLCLSGKNNKVGYISIGQIVSEFSRGNSRKVLSFNPKTGVMEKKDIIAAIKKKDYVYQLTFDNDSIVRATKDHKFCTLNGNLESAISVENMKLGDEIESIEKFSIDSEWKDVFSAEDIVTGSLLGDGCLFQRKNKPDGTPYFGNSFFSMTKTETVMNYMEWVVQKLSVFSRMRISNPRKSGYTGKYTNRNVSSGQHEYWTDLRKKWYPNGKKIVPKDLQLNMKSLAIWLMDDGGPGLRSIHSASFSKEENLFLVDQINNLLQAPVAELRNYYSSNKQKSFYQIELKISQIPNDKLAELYSLIHPDYRYKLKGRAVRIPFIKNKTKLKEKIFIGERMVYDIEVEDNHNFFVENLSSRNCLIFDELDLIDKDILSEATFIADPDRSGKPPIFIYLSSRKSSSGPIQQKIDEADVPNSGIRLHKWSIVDWMQACPPERHKPEYPKELLHVHTETLEVIPNTAFQALNPEYKQAYSSILAFEGCKACPVFSICRTKSAKQQSKSKMLRDIGFVKNTLLNAGDPDKINAQILNLKPESSGIVFNKFNRNLHVKPTADIWYFAFNVYPTDRMGNPREPSKEELIKELRQNGWRLHCGVDFGFVDPAVAILIAYKKSDDKVIVLHTESSTGYANPDWLAYIKENIYLKYGFDLLCPDTADKSSTSVASSMNMPARGEKPLTIDAGVSWLRSKLWNAMRQQVHFMILDDTKNMFLVKCMESWTYARGLMGYDYSRFADDDWTHGPDALRYAIDPFITSNTSVIQASQVDQFDFTKKANFTTVEGMQEALRIHYASEYNVDIAKKNDEDAEKMLKSGSATILF